MTVHDVAPDTADESPSRASQTLTDWLLVLFALAALAALALTLAGHAQLLMPGSDKGLEDLTAAIDRVRGPATATLGSLSGLGLLAGGAMTALGIPQGIRMMAMSGLAAGGVLLGNGIVA